MIHTAFFNVNSCFSVNSFFFFCFWCHIVKKVKLTVEISPGKAKMSIYMIIKEKTVNTDGIDVDFVSKV